MFSNVSGAFLRVPSFVEIPLETFMSNIEPFAYCCFDSSPLALHTQKKHIAKIVIFFFRNPSFLDNLGYVSSKRRISETDAYHDDPRLNINKSVSLYAVFTDCCFC